MFRENIDFTVTDIYGETHSFNFYANDLESMDELTATTAEKLEDEIYEMWQVYSVFVDTIIVKAEYSVFKEEEEILHLTASLEFEPDVWDF